MEWVLLIILGFFIWAYSAEQNSLYEREMRKREQRNAYQREYYYRKKLQKGKK